MPCRITGSKPKPGISYEKAERYSYEEFERSCQEKGFLADAIVLRLWDFIGYPDPDYVLIGSLVDIAAHGTHGIKVEDYEVIGSEGQDIFLKVTLVKKPD